LEYHRIHSTLGLKVRCTGLERIPVDLLTMHPCLYFTDRKSSCDGPVADVIGA
jgi:hypothetical protein